ncbi:MAG: ABC transporter permease [Methanomassiliicoccales archaeon]|jgi:ABC-2 type transport system permease protein
MNVMRPLYSYLEKMFAIFQLEVKKLRHEPSELLMRAVQPVLWLLVFGGVMAQARVIPTGGDYLDFLTPGILAQSVLFVSIFFGISLIWEKDMGIVQKFLTSPAPRTAMIAGRALSAGVRGLSQAVIIYFVAIMMGVNLRLDPLSVSAVIIVVVLGAVFFSSLSMFIACIVHTRERFMGIGQLLTMPLFFASNAIYPIALMPEWLKWMAQVNPLTYMVDAMRGCMVVSGSSEFGIVTDLGILFVSSIVMILVAGKLFHRVVL